VHRVFTPSQDGIARRDVRVPPFHFEGDPSPLLIFTVAGEGAVHLGATRDAAQNAFQF
jgi:hypothetical protein